MHAITIQNSSGLGRIIFATGMCLLVSEACAFNMNNPCLVAFDSSQPLFAALLYGSVICLQ